MKLYMLVRERVLLFVSLTSIILATLLGPSAVAVAQTPEIDTEGTVGYVVDQRGNVVKSSSGLCWRTAYWTPAMAIEECDPDFVGRSSSVPKPSSVRMPAFAPGVAPALAPAPERVFEALSPEQAGVKYPVWYATNRKTTQPVDDCRTAFSTPDSLAVRGEVTYGKCFVDIPESHILGTTARSYCDRLLNRNADVVLMGDHKPFKTFNAYLSDIKEALDVYSKVNGKKDVLVFIHGFNVSFQDAAIRAAQIGYDLRGPASVTALYSWPSSPRNSQLVTLPLGYTADEASIEASEQYLADFLIGLARGLGPKKRVHIIAHSMGNRGLLRGLFGAVTQAEAKSRVRFGKIFLAAPDVDVDVFKRLAKVYPRVSERTTLYVSKRDEALGLSHVVHGYPRAGNMIPPIVSVGIDTVDASNVATNFLGQIGADTSEVYLNHSTYAKSAPLLCDIRLALDGQLAGSDQRNYLVARDSTEGTVRYWEMPRAISPNVACLDQRVARVPIRSNVRKQIARVCDNP
jgi:esterase/lipase superfamily enzyme